MACLTLMEDELYNAAVNGDIRLLSETNITKHGVSYYKDQTTPQRNNIIHIAAAHCRTQFVQDALAQFPELAWRKNRNLDTPLHVAVRRGSDEIVKLLVSFEGCATEEESQVDEDWPWMARNLQGDTPLHLALSSQKLNVVMDLLQIGSTIALSLINVSQETPLHIFLKHCIGIHSMHNPLLEEGVLNLRGVYKSKGQISTQRSPSTTKTRENLLVELLRYKPATCMPDEKGLTPLLIAAQQGNLQALRLILNHCPQSAEVCDPYGRTVLHYLKKMFNPSQETHYARNHHHAQDCIELETSVGLSSTYYWGLKELLNIPEIDAIKDARDSHGNTPAHVALESTDFVLVRVLFECFADFTIKNKDGVCALDLIKSVPDFAAKMEEVAVTEKVLNKLMDENLIRAAENGDVTLFQGISALETDIESGQSLNPDGYDYFQSRTSGGLGILHLAVKHGHQTFIEEAIRRFPSLVLTADLSGDTPLHVGARLKKAHRPAATTLLQLTKETVDNFRTEAGPLFLNVLPWRQKNSRGDTPLHEALRSGNYDMAISLMKIDGELSSVENKAGETPLHVLAKYGTYTKSDKVGALVKQLMSQNVSVSKRDKLGICPLLRAAHCGRTRVAYWIAENCPSSVQFRDPNGRTFLHLLRLEPTAELDAITIEDMFCVHGNILKLTGAEFDGLRISQDHAGNTPLHFALKTKNFVAAKFLLLWCVESETRQEMNIVDNDGCSVSKLLEVLTDDTPYVKELKDLALLAQERTKVEASGKKMMDINVYRKAVDGKTNLFSDDQTKNQLGFLEAPDGSNILHLALQHGQMAFAEEVMKHYPDLIFERNSHGDTPLHTAAKFCNGVFGLHDDFSALWKEVCGKYHDGLSEEFLVTSPWRVKNSKGNTPLHEAMHSQNLILASQLLDFDSEVTGCINNAGETPLHVYARRVYIGALSNAEIPLDVVRRCKSAVYVRDREGLTPLLRAAKAGNILAAREILTTSPESIQLRDFRGRSFLHLLRVRDDVSEEMVKELYRVTEVDALWKTEDFDENTALHLAIENDNSIGAKLLANRFYESRDQHRATQLLNIYNNQGKSVLDLLASHDAAPLQVLNLLITTAAGIDMHGLNTAGGWIRSGYGVCRSQIKDMTSTLSVVAGLLTTVTFAAAFQVPGGYDGGSGIPILLRRAAFQVFMISNSFAMCGSMTVLIFLLWVMFTGSAKRSFLLLDLSIAILQLSFCATLMAFMTGVYATISHNALWLAIFICTLCSTIILLARKRHILRITRLVPVALHRLGFWDGQIPDLT